MKSEKISQSIIYLFLALTLLTGCSGGDDNSSTVADTPEIVITPAAGDWVANTDFGTIILTVDASGISIPNASYSFNDWTCGHVTLSGTNQISRDGGWNINNVLFDNSYPGNNQTIVISGGFDTSRQVFSGTWDFNQLDTGDHCSGSWEATGPQ